MIFNSTLENPRTYEVTETKSHIMKGENVVVASSKEKCKSQPKKCVALAYTHEKLPSSTKKSTMTL